MTHAYSIGGMSMKKIFCIYFLFALVLVSCAPGSEQFGQAATIVADSLTQTASSAGATAVSTPLGFPDVFASYKSSNQSIQFNYPEGWY